MDVEFFKGGLFFKDTPFFLFFFFNLSLEGSNCGKCTCKYSRYSHEYSDKQLVPTISNDVFDLYRAKDNCSPIRRLTIFNDEFERSLRR